jgi:hypothetical protein
VADDEVQPVEPIHPVRGTGPVQKPMGRRGWRRWMAKITRDQFRAGRPPRRIVDSDTPGSVSDTAQRRAWEDELTGEGKLFDVDA